MRRKARMKEEIEQKEALGSALNTLARELGVRPGDSYARFVEKAGTDPRLTNIVSESRADYGDVWGGSGSGGGGCHHYTEETEGGSRETAPCRFKLSELRCLAPTASNCESLLTPFVPLFYSGNPASALTVREELYEAYLDSIEDRAAAALRARSARVARERAEDMSHVESRRRSHQRSTGVKDFQALLEEHVRRPDASWTETKRVWATMGWSERLVGFVWLLPTPQRK